MTYVPQARGIPLPVVDLVCSIDQKYRLFFTTCVECLIGEQDQKIRIDVQKGTRLEQRLREPDRTKTFPQPGQNVVIVLRNSTVQIDHFV